MKYIRSGIVLLLAILCLFSACSAAQTADATEKTVTVTVINGEEQTPFEITTTADTLRGVLEELNIVKGSETQYGLFVSEVCGYAADESKEEWWCFTKGGESLATGVDDTSVADGDAFEVTLMTGY